MAPSLPLEPGSHEGFLNWNDKQVPCKFVLEPAKLARIVVYTNEWTTGGFPKDHIHHERLVGTLRTNQEVVLGHVYTQEILGGRHLGTAQWALVGLQISHYLEWERTDVHISGLESILPRPIISTRFPDPAAPGPVEFAAKVDRQPVEPSTWDGVTVEPGYLLRTIDGNLYKHSIVSYGSATFHAQAALPIEAWMNRWIEPLRSVVSISTGRQERVGVVRVRTTRGVQPANAVLFGPGIHQEYWEAERLADGAGNPLIPLFDLENSPPLAQLLGRWADLSTDGPAHALLRLSQDVELPTSARFLLLMQAAESLHRGISAEEDKEYNTRKEELRRIRSLLAQAGHARESKFVKNYVEARRAYSLESRLRALLKESELESVVPLWADRLRDLEEELSAVGQVGTDLPGRLAQARNAISHGTSRVSANALRDPTRLLELLVRVTVLSRLGFDLSQSMKRVEFLSKT